MEILPLKSRLIKPKDNLLEIFEESLKNKKKQVKNNDIWVITSKVISLSENRIVKATLDKEKIKIIKEESDVWLGGKPYGFTIKNGILIPRAGIDESNSKQNELILWPLNSWKTAQILRKKVKKRFGIQNFGIVITDSTCRPLRHGVSNIALAWSGFEGVSDERGKLDLFGQPLEVTHRAIADSLAAAAGILTGEAAESIPFVLIRQSGVKFTERTIKPPQFQPKDCLFASIYPSKFRNLKI